MATATKTAKKPVTLTYRGIAYKHQPLTCVRGAWDDRTSYDSQAFN